MLDSAQNPAFIAQSQQVNSIVYNIVHGLNGSISAEHVRNVLARLTAPAAPEQAETTLQLSEPPRADTARYDRLRPTHQDGQEVIHA